ncbi:nuclease-related domain-containing protein [Thioalkalivibrio sp. AKL19]|uniref:nuclease-related domain-containing protein n=1 Tax=Thioalkalivibrio sp. AKL19 TaxID=1266914 RepID=UPI0003F93F2D|nr:NERD domain-containing protein [Thioalkalivibrio sp. AKL19]
MDIKPGEIFLNAALQFWWAWLLAALVAVARLPKVKGWLGEVWIRLILAVGLDGKSGRVVHDVTLETGEGTTQIDHVLVSRSGIFVIETKNMRGWISGSAREPQWTQRIYRRSFRFQNPLRQNYRHERAVADSLQVTAEHVHSVVVFVGGSTFKTPMPENVVRGLGLLGYIRSFRTAAWNDDEVRTLVERLQGQRLAPSRQTHRNHVQQLRERHAEPACPQCGSAMAKRKARRGSRAGREFWGCTRYPECRGTKAIQ